MDNKRLMKQLVLAATKLAADPPATMQQQMQTIRETFPDLYLYQVDMARFSLYDKWGNNLSFDVEHKHITYCPIVGIGMNNVSTLPHNQIDLDTVDLATWEEYVKTIMFDIVQKFLNKKPRIPKSIDTTALYQAVSIKAQVCCGLVPTNEIFKDLVYLTWRRLNKTQALAFLNTPITIPTHSANIQQLEAIAQRIYRR